MLSSYPYIFEASVKAPESCLVMGGAGFESESSESEILISFLGAS